MVPESRTQGPIEDNWERLATKLQVCTTESTEHEIGHYSNHFKKSIGSLWGSLPIIEPPGG